MPSLSLVFAGSPAAAVPSLRLLAESVHRVRAVVTREDSPQGRRGVVTETPVAAEAATLGIPVIKANRLAGAATEAVAELAPDLGVIVAYGGLVREPLLSTPRLGWINLH
ncbi:MAG TPA: formyltransferase family protein, partial [Galbitalea sp.]